MIEQAIYFGLGCAVAGLLALAFTPVLWARALRLTHKRLQAQIPVSIEEVWADRDSLRAEFAVGRRLLEQEIERLNGLRTADMAALGRRAGEILALTDQRTAMRLHAETQDQTIEDLERSKTETEASFAATQAAMLQNHGYYEQRLAKHEELRRAHAALDVEADQLRATIGSLQTRARGLEMTIDDATRAHATLERQLDAARQQAGLAGETRDFLSSQLATAQSSQESLRQRLIHERVVVSGLEDGKRALQNEIDALAAKLRRSEQDLEAAQRWIGDAKDRERAASLRDTLAHARPRAGLAVEEAAPASVLPLAMPVVSPPQADAGDALLRKSLHSLGLAVAEMVAARREQPLEKAEPREEPVS